MPINLIDSIQPKSDGDYPMVEDKYVKGGFHTVSSILERDSIPSKRRKVGMIVNVINDKKYELNSDLTTWKEFSGGSNLIQGANILLEETENGTIISASGTVSSVDNVARQSVTDLTTVVGDKANSIHNHTSTDITDIKVTAPSNGDVLSYNLATSKWVNIPISADGKVKISSIDSSKYLNEIVDGATLVFDSGKLVAKSLDGMEISILELNTLKGMTENVKSLFNNLASAGMSYQGVVSTKADLNLITTLPSGSVKIVLADETQSNKRMTYIYDGTTWDNLGENTIQVRDFTVNPINLQSEVTGVLSQANIDTTGLATASDLLGYTKTTDLANTYATKEDMSTKAPIVHTHAISDITGLQTELNNKVDDSLLGVTSGIATLGTDGKVVSTQLPSNIGLELGETSTTAYRGDNGKTAYDHSQVISGNPHNVTKTDVGLANVINLDTSTTANITDSLDKRFITDAQKTILSNTSGVNTNDETTATIKQKLGTASTTTDGYLTSADFITFNNKVDKVDGKSLVSDTEIEKIHSSSLLGTKDVDETNIGNDKYIKYNSTTGKLEYSDVSGGGTSTAIDDITPSLDKTFSSSKISTDYALKSEMLSLNSINGSMGDISILGDSGILIENNTENRTITISRTDLAAGTLPPMNVNGKSVEGGNQKITLKWIDPNDTVVDGQTLSVWSYTILVRKIGSYPSNENDGVTVLTNSIRNQYASVGYEDIGLTNNVKYYYRFFTVSTLGAINRDLDNRISCIPINYRKMTVNIDLTNSNPSTCITYADDAITMTPKSFDWDIFFGHKPCLFKNGAVVGYLNPNDFTKFIDGTNADITSGDAGDVMIEFPRRGLNITTIGTTLTVSMTDNPNDDSFSYNAHSRGMDYKDYFYLGTYKGYSLSSKLRSLSGKQINVSQTINDFRTQSQANGVGYEQSGFYQLIFRQAMYLLKYKNLNSQVALGRGYSDVNDSSVVTGGTNSKGMDYGETTGKLQMKLFGLEDFWGNVYEWIDGLATDAAYNIFTATNGFNDARTGYTNNGQGSTSHIDGFMNKCQGNTKTGFIVKDIAGSETTYFCDFASSNSSCVPFYGGSLVNGSVTGVFCLRIIYPVSNSSPVVGARLMYL